MTETLILVICSMAAALFFVWAIDRTWNLTEQEPKKFKLPVHEEWKWTVTTTETPTCAKACSNCKGAGRKQKKVQ